MLPLLTNKKVGALRGCSPEGFDLRSKDQDKKTEVASSRSTPNSSLLRRSVPAIKHFLDSSWVEAVGWSVVLVGHQLSHAW